MLIKAPLFTWSCIFILMMATVSLCSIEIPCINTTSIAANRSITPFPIVSNQSYTLTNCVSDVVFIDIALRSPSFLFENVTVRVTGGSVLPRLSTAISLCATLSVPFTVRNIYVVVEQAHVEGDMSIASSSELPLTMVNISSGTGTVQNISVSFVNSSLRLVVTTSDVAAAVVAPLLFLRPGAGDASVILSGVTIFVANSFLSVNASIIGNSSSLNNIIVMASFSMTQTGVMELIEVTAMNSYQECETAVISIRSDADKNMSNVALRGASLTADLKTNVTIRCRVPRVSSDIVAAVKIGSSMEAVQNVTILIKDSFAMIQNICRSNCSADDASFPRARVVCVAGNTRESNLMLSNVTIVASRSVMILDSPKSAFAVSVQSNAALNGLFINVLNCFAEVSSGNLNVALSSRTQAIVDVSSSSNATEVNVLVRQVTATFFVESGDCMIAHSTVIGGLDNISYSRLEVVDVVVVSRIMNGTILMLFFGVLAPITMGASIVNIGMQSTASLNVGVGLSISVINATLDVLHATTVPTGPLFLLVVSIASIVNVVRLLTNSNISVANSHIVRSFPSTYSSLAGVVPGVGARYNITAVVNLFDATSAVLDINPQLTTFSSLMYAATGGLPPTIVHINVSTRVMKNCTVSYNIAPQSTDCVALVMSPGVSNMCTYTIEDTQPLPLKLPVGSIFGAMGQSRLVNSNITARRVRGLFALMFSSFKPTSFEGPLTTLMFNDISLQYADYGIPMYRYPIGSQDTAFVVDMQERFAGSGHSAVLTITHSLFKGFTSLLMPDSINITSASAPRRRVSPTLLALGCNVWDDVGLPHTRITSNTTVLSYVQYPWSVYDESIACHGLPGTSTVSVSTTVGPLRLAPPLPAVSDLTVSTAYHSTSSAVYASLISVSTGGAVASLERGVGALRLASQCSQSTGNVDAKAIAPPLIDSDVDEPMSYDLSANPLHLPLPVGEDSLQYAAGASVGNAVLSCVIGAVLHLIATLQRRCATAALQSRQSSLLTALVSMLPSSLLLGSLAIPYGTLGQPAISACVGLLLSVHRTPQSVACGVVMLLCFWLAFPIACAYLVLAGRGRRNSMFVLQSTSVVVATRGKVNNRLTRLRHMHQYLLSPRTEWRLHPGCSKRGTPERRYAEFLLENMEAVFGAYVGGREWYFVVEWGVLVVSAAVLGAAEITAIDDAGSACVAAQWGIGTVLALSAVQVVLCVWLRPFTVRAEFYVSVLLGTMSVVCQALALAGDVDASAQVDSTAAIVAIVVLVLFMLSGVTMRIRRRHSVLAADNADPSMNEVTSARQRSMRTHQQLCVVDNQWTAAPPAGQLDQLTTLVALVCEQSRKHNECLVGCRRR